MRREGANLVAIIFLGLETHSRINRFMSCMSIDLKFLGG